MTNRTPSLFTMRLPGSVRSDSRKYGPLGSGTVGPHHASSIRPSAAPAAMPASMPSPVFDAAPTVQSTPIGCCSYSSRMARLCSNPPDPTITPRLALMVSWVLPWVAVTPVTRPVLPSTRPVSGVLSQTGTPADSSPVRSPPASAWPMVSGGLTPVQFGGQVPGHGLGGHRGALPR